VLSRLKTVTKSLLFCLFLFCLGNWRIMSMNTTPTKDPQLQQQPSLTPPTVQITVPNYAKVLLNAIACDNMNKIAETLTLFFQQIPYNMQNMPTIKDIDDYKANAFFHLSLAHALCQTIETCAYSDKLLGNIHTKFDANGVVYLPLQYNDKTYILQFFVGDDKADPEIFRYQINNNKSTPTVISIEIVFAITGKFNGIKIRKLLNQKNSTLQNIMPLTLDENPYHEDNAYKEAIQYIDHPLFLELILKDLYNNIPWPLHIPREKFYHDIFIAVFVFVGLGFIEREKTTFDGRADAIIYGYKEIPIIFEFKLNQSTDKAIEQIIGRRYFTTTSTNLVSLVGINIEYNFKKNDFCVNVQHIYYKQQPLIELQETTPEGNISSKYLQRNTESTNLKSFRQLAF
jgi:hypothetical protein